MLGTGLSEDRLDFQGLWKIRWNSTVTGIDDISTID
jgi:hypothetical protein